MQKQDSGELQTTFQIPFYYSPLWQNPTKPENSAYCTVLVVDDDQATRELMRLYLKSLGHNVLLAENGTEALEYVKNEPLDLIILDIILPERDGLVICAAIRQLVETPILMLTAANKIEYAARAFQLGADGYITKPFTFNTLKMRIRTFLSEQPARD
ncbi:MAG: response regulator [Caldilineaceae bacterium]